MPKSKIIIDMSKSNDHVWAQQLHITHWAIYDTELLITITTVSHNLGNYTARRIETWLDNISSDNPIIIELVNSCVADKW